MLDMGAEPERLKGVFPPRFVDRAVKTWQPWREEALKLARRGATPNEIRSAVTKLTMEASRETGQSKGQSWGNIVTMLKAHGFDYSQQPPPDTFPELAERREEIMKLVQQGLPKAEIARKFGLHRTAVNTLICRIREGRYPHLQRYLTPEMA
jgi:DNA-binding NarL/FixJ family response regulator